MVTLSVRGPTSDVRILRTSKVDKEITIYNGRYSNESSSIQMNWK